MTSEALRGQDVLSVTIYASPLRLPEARIPNHPRLTLHQNRAVNTVYGLTLSQHGGDHVPGLSRSGWSRRQWRICLPFGVRTPEPVSAAIWNMTSTFCE